MKNLLFSSLMLVMSFESYANGESWLTRPIQSALHRDLSFIEPPVNRGEAPWIAICGEGDCSTVVSPHVSGNLISVYVTSEDIVQKLSGIELPERVHVYTVSQDTMNYMTARAAKTVDEAEANRDPNPGNKMLNCVIDGVACGASVVGTQITDWAWIFVIQSCNSARNSCNEWRSAWQKETEYWKAKEEENKKEGKGPSGNGGSGGSGGSIPTTPAGTAAGVAIPGGVTVVYGEGKITYPEVKITEWLY